MPQNPDPLKVIIDNIYELIASGAYDEADRLIKCIQNLEDHDPVLLFFKAICRYEQDQDLECLQLILQFLNRAPRHTKADYAVFTAAACLANLGMEEDSILLLNTLPASYPDLAPEKLNISKKVQIKAKAKESCEAIVRLRTRPL